MSVGVCVTRRAQWCHFISLVEKTEVDVEVDIRKIVLVVELQARDLHRCIQYTCSCYLIQMSEDGVQNLP